REAVMAEEKHLTMSELEAGFDGIRQGAKKERFIAFILWGAPIDGRGVFGERGIDLGEGVFGGKWGGWGSFRWSGCAAHPGMQLNIMNARVIALVAREKSRWPLAGDQLFIEMDVSSENAPPGTRLALGSAVIEVTD